VPHAVEVDSQIITVYDPGVHERAETPISAESDRRWIQCQRPRVFAGGELTAEMLDLPSNSAMRYYVAPLQMKANNGVLILDDFGRQRMRPEELLNRWMTPLDLRVDFLTLPGGRKFEIPFDPLVIFSTNLEVNRIADEAFMRRIPNKIKVGHATAGQFVDIFRRVCETRSLSYEQGLPEFLVGLITQELKQQLCQCQPGDLLDQVRWAAEYERVKAQITEATMRKACQNYFVVSENN
jgi:predicted ATPase with chaperone activity